MTGSRHDSDRGSLKPDLVVSTEWLQSHLDDGRLVVLDCSWYPPEQKKSGFDDYRAGHIPGARHFDLAAVADRTSPYANMLPPADEFAAAAGRLGIASDTAIVVYDSTYVSARVWWMFREFGHRDVRVLDGGLRRWKAEGRPLETGVPPAPAAARFVATRDPGHVADWRQVLQAIETGGATIIDARTAERFSGRAPSGDPGVASGHMPGAINIPWSRLIEQSGGFRFVTREAAERVFRDAGVDLDRPIVATCGSGVTSAVVAFTLARLGLSDWKLYDGSWNEWGQRPDLPRESL